jgi:tetratricopeptide (TPR) repeat protein
VTARVALCLVLASGAASAGPEQEARAHWDHGSALYDAGDYRAALREFEAANRIYPRREFLINLGQAHRLLNEFAEARALYAHYLETADPNDRYSAEVRDILAELDRRLAHAPPSEPPQKSVAPVENAPRRRGVWILAVVGAAVLVLAAVAVGVGLALSSRAPQGCDTGVVSCIDLRR